MLASIIIPAYNAEATLAKCIEACLAQTGCDAEVIVVDDGSTDATPRIAQGFPVHYIRQENRGPAAARNRGAAEARGDLFAFTDADCVPEPDWLELLANGLVESVGATGGTYTIANAESALARMVHEEIAARHARLEGDVDFLGSFNVAYDREAFEAVAGFDETFKMASCEDNDLAYRLHDKGYRLCFIPAARVAHFHPTRLGPYLRAQMRHGFWRVKLYAKHPGRARTGDRYAGLADLMAPLIALVVIGAMPVCAAFGLLLGSFWAAAVPVAAFACAYGLLHAPLALAMARRTGDRRMVLFMGVAALRDFARALGMLHGVGRFIVLRKGRP